MVINHLLTEMILQVPVINGAIINHINPYKWPKINGFHWGYDPTCMAIGAP